MKLFSAAIVLILFLMTPDLGRAEKKDTESYIVNVQNLVLRQEPTLKSPKTPHVLKKYEQVDVIKQRGRKWVFIAARTNPEKRGWARTMAVLLADPSKIKRNQQVRLRGLERLGYKQQPIPSPALPYTAKDMATVDTIEKYTCQSSLDDFLSSGELGKVRRKREEQK